MDLSNFPQELVDAIAAFLSFEDVCACSRVNTKWRQAFDNNRIWKRFCSFHPNYFDNKVSKIKCSPMVEGCKSKIQAINESFVRSNHLSGTFHIEEVQFDSRYCDSILDFVDDFGNHWLFISCSNGMKFESEHYIYVWNLNEGASIHDHTKTLGKIKRGFLSEMKMIKNKLFVFYENIVHVFQFANPVYKLEWVDTIILENDAFPNDIIRDIKIVTVDNFIVGCSYSNHYTQQKLSPLICVWNVDGILIYNKQKTLHHLRDMTYQNYYPVCYVKTNNLDKILIVIKVEQLCFIVLIFDVLLLQFTDFFVEKQNIQICSQDICGNTVSLMYIEERNNLQIDCYSVIDGKLILNIQLGNSFFFFHALIKDAGGYGDLVFFANKKFSAVNVSTKKKISSFKASGSKPFGLIILSGVLIVLVSRFGKNIYYEVCNYKSGSILYKLDFPFSQDFEQHIYDLSCMKSSMFPSKIIAYEDPFSVYPFERLKSKVLVISFW